MKRILNNIKDYLNDEKNATKKKIFFFAFYGVFFIVLFGMISFGGDKEYLFQEYEKGNSSNDDFGTLCTNCVFDYKVTIDGVLHDYYGKRNGDVESFKYNNFDYYHGRDEFFINKEIWVKSDNPYQFYELLNYDNISLIMKQATLNSQNEDNQYHYLISSNSLNQILYHQSTDYDEEADTFDVFVDSSSNIEKIVYQLNHFCKHRDNCQNTLSIEMNFEMFDSVKKIDNPIE